MADVRKIETLGATGAGRKLGQAHDQCSRRFRARSAGRVAIDDGTWAMLPYLMPINPIGSENKYGNYQMGQYYGGVWDAAARTIEPAQSITFVALPPRKGSIASYKWVSPGGTPSTSTAQSPRPIRFDQSGTYLISLIRSITWVERPEPAHPDDEGE